MVTWKGLRRGILLLFLALILLGFLRSPYPALSAGSLALLLVGWSLSWVIPWLVKGDKLLWGAVAFIAVGAMSALYGVFTASWRSGKLTSLSLYAWVPHLNFLGDTTNPNVLAGAIIVVMPTALMLLVGRSIPWQVRLFSGLSLALMGGAFILTQSWVPFLALLGGLGVMSVRWNRQLILPLAVLAVVTTFALIRWGPGYLAALIPNTVGYSGWSSRRELWTRALTAIGDAPFTGIGLGMFPWVMPLLYPPLLWGIERDPSHAHNLFLQVALDIGVPGLMTFLCLMAITALILWRAYDQLRSEGKAAEAAVALGMLGGLVAALAHGLIDAVTWSAKPTIFLWAIIGFAGVMEMPEGAPFPRIYPTGNRRKVVIGMMALALVFGAILLSPRLVSAYWTGQGHAALSYAIMSQDEVAWERAEGYLNRALAWDKANGRAYRLLGEAALWRGDVDAAESFLSRAAAFGRDDGYANFFLGCTFWQLGRAGDAVEAWKQAARSLGGLPFYLDRQRRGKNNVDGVWHLDIPNTPEVRRMIKEVAETAIAGGEKHVWLYLLIAGLSESQTEALRWLEEGRRVNPGSWVPVAVLAEAAFRRGDYALSQSLWQEAIAKSPPRADYEFALGQAYEAAGQLEEALAAYEKALKLAPGKEKYQAKVREIQKALNKGEN